MRPIRRLIAIWCLGLAGPLLLAAQSRSVSDVAYSKPQAARGKAIYGEFCARCHGETLLGGDDAKPLGGEAFLDRWNGRMVWELFDVTRRTMPDDGPAVLSRAQTADVVAYLLSANGFPAAASELASDDASLKDILIGKKKP